MVRSSTGSGPGGASYNGAVSVVTAAGGRGFIGSPMRRSGPGGGSDSGAGLLGMPIAVGGPLDVIYYGIEKQRKFLQTSATVIRPDGDGGFVFQAYVAPFALADILQAALEGPDGRAVALPPDAGFKQRFLEERYADRAQIETNRPPGVYVLAVNTANNGARRLTLRLPADAYPGVPQFTSLRGDEPVNPFVPLDLVWFPFEGATENDFIDIFLTDEASGEELYSATFSFNPLYNNSVSGPDKAASVVVPVGRMALGRAYVARLVFWRAVEIDVTTYPGADGYVAFSSATEFHFETLKEPDPSGNIPIQIVIRSDATTLAAATESAGLLNSGDARGLEFSPASDGVLGSAAAIPPDAPVGTKVVSVGAGPRSGFFRVLFDLPLTAGAIKLTGVANMDDVGRVFLNGTPLTPTLLGDVPGQVRPGANVAFSTFNPGHFRRGPNELLIANYNPSGGGSGGAFYATLTYNIGFDIEVTAAPVIFGDPQNVTVDPGEEAYLDVIAVGDDPLTFQWRLDGRDIAGATNRFFYIEKAGAADMGDYTVVVRNPAGSITSRPARLSVLIPPDITQHPKGTNVAVGAALTLDVVVGGQGPFAYQWLLNGEAIPGATSPFLTLSNVQASDSGDYSVLVEGPFDSVESDTATVTAILPALTLSDAFALRGRLESESGSGRGSNRRASREVGEPAPGGAPGGSSVWIAWVAPGTGVMSIDTFGSSIDTLLAVYTGSSVQGLTPIAFDDDTGLFFCSRVRFNAVAGQEYLILVDGFDGEEGDIVLTHRFSVSANPVPMIARHPVDVVSEPGAGASFSVALATPPPGSPAVTFQWFRNGAEMPNATGGVLAVTSVQVRDVGEYFVRVRLGTETLDSVPAFLELSVPGEGNPDASTEDKFASLRATSAGAQAAPASFAGLKGHGGRPRGGLASGYSGAQIFNTYGSTTEAGEPNHCAVIGGASQWFSYRAEATGALTITTEGSDFDTVLAVYTGLGDSFATLELVGCDNNSGADGRDSTVRIQAAAGTVYHIAVDGVGGETGNVRLGYDLSAPPRLSVAGGRAIAGGFEFTLHGSPGARCSIQISSNLVEWATWVITNVPPASVLQLKEPPGTSESRRFFRVRAN